MRRASANFAPPRDKPSATSLSTDATLSTEECTPSSTKRWYRSRTRALKRSVCGLPPFGRMLGCGVVRELHDMTNRDPMGGRPL